MEMEISASLSSEDSLESKDPPHSQQQEISQEQQEKELEKEQDQQQNTIPVSENVDQLRVYLVPFRWWKDAQDSSLLPDPIKRILYTASPASSYGGAMKLINNLFGSDLTFNLKKENESRSENNENGEAVVSGREYALVSGEMWLQAFKWHSDSKNSAKNGNKFTASEEDSSDVFPLQLKLSVLPESNHFSVKISKKENSVECFKRACKIFSVETDMLKIWDLSGKSSLWCPSDTSKTTNDSQQLLEQEVMLELQVYGLSDPVRNKGIQIPNGTSSIMNGYGGNFTSTSFKSNSSGSAVSSCEAGTLGLTGLQNLGNTCFMNSAIQCLAHTPKIVDFFLGDYKTEINHENPLGMRGEIASAFGDLLKKLWSPGATPLAPRTFKSKLAHFAPQFSGYNQHDSQEFLAFLLDGLHEDLNRVKCKPYVELKDIEGRPDEEVADEYWKIHLDRNDSIIVDVCQGQYRSTLVCPVCKKVSFTFDPFMYLTLPLPSTLTRTMTLTVVNPCGSTSPSPFTVHVPKSGNLDDLIRALSIACSLGVDERLLIAEVYNFRIIRILDDSANSLSLLRDEDQLVAYRVPRDMDGGALVIFTHKHMEEKCMKPDKVWKAFGIPLVAYSKVINGSDVRNLYSKLLSSYYTSNEDDVSSSHNVVGDTFEPTTNEDSVSQSIGPIGDVSEGSTEAGDATVSSPRLSGCNEKENVPEADAISRIGFKFFVAHDGNTEGPEMEMNEPVKSVVVTPARLNIVVHWSDDVAIEQFKAPLLCPIPEVLKVGLSTRRPQEPVSLYKCVEAFLQEEPLGPDDMWYCPDCKIHCQANKKLDLWRLPDVLVIHLKRFTYNRYIKNKLETFVDFPTHDLELSARIADKNGSTSHRYMLYAISNHYGSLGGGHYTAYIHHGGGQWYDFDDSHVFPISEDKIKTSAAYVLFYKKVETAEN